MAMGLYRDHILPHLIHLSMRQQNLAAYRARVLPAAQGRVLEIGIGSGLNLPYYSTTVEQVIGLDPSPKLLAMAREAARRTSLPLDLIENSAEAIPLYNRSIDTVVTTWTMCSIPGRAACARRDATRLEARRPSAVCRTRTLTGSRNPPLAGSAYTGLAPGWRRVPLESCNRRTDRRGWLSNRAA
jgi:SAM-dependent methyltransferase